MNTKEFLDQKYSEYNTPGFIPDDPVCIPHRFTAKQDIEIMGLWAAVLAWGQRKTIIKKSLLLSSWMDHKPYEFILNHSGKDLKTFEKFCHRTFNGTDALYFIDFFRYHYSNSNTLEDAFVKDLPSGSKDTGPAIAGFHRYFFSLEDHPTRTKKHIATPERNSSCKRLNMFLRWMVRKDNRGVDFGIWTKISPSQLICPCDVHVLRVSRKLGLIKRKQNDWKTALELTMALKKFDPDDPVKYDFALFGLGIEEKF